jgi:hypothetical protein
VGKAESPGTYISFQVFLRGEAGIFSGDTQIAGGDSSRLNTGQAPPDKNTYRIIFYFLNIESKKS